MRGKVLIIDDDPDIRELLKKAFSGEQFQCREVSSPEKAFEIIKRNIPELIILDINFEGVISGWDTLRILKQKKNTASIPVIMVSGVFTGSDYAADALNGGADDFLSKPFSPRELIARCKAILRRLNPESFSDEILRSENGEIIVDVTTHIVQIKTDGRHPGIKEINLSPREFRLLCCFLKHQGKLLTKERLSEMAWDEEYFNTSRTIDKHIQTLRKKLGPLGGTIKTIPLEGYKFILR